MSAIFTAPNRKIASKVKANVRVTVLICPQLNPFSQAKFTTEANQEKSASPFIQRKSGGRKKDATAIVLAPMALQQERSPGRNDGGRHLPPGTLRALNIARNTPVMFSPNDLGIQY